MKLLFRSSLLIAALCWNAIGYSATVRVVKHVPGSGEYASIAAAITDSVSGDTIELGDNDGPFSEAVFFEAKTGITIQGAAALNPRPTLAGVPSTYVVPSEQATYPNGATISGHNSNYGNSFRNMIIDGTATSMVVDVRFAVNSLENVDIIMGPNNVVGLMSAGGDLAMTNCKLTGNPTKGLEHWSGTVTMNNVNWVLTSGQIVDLVVGKLVANNCQFITPADRILKTRAFNEIGGGVEMDLTNCLLRSTAAVGVVSVLVDFDRITSTHSYQHKAVIDNCDFIGSQAGEPFPTVSAISFNLVMDSVIIKDSIFYHTRYGPMSNNIVTANVSEDYNIYKMTNYDDGGMAGITKGSHSVVLGDSDKLYADDLGGSFTGDFRLDQQSVAATLNSSGTPVYAGSLGLHPTVPVELSALNIE